MSEIPQKQFYKVSEVCSYTDTQPYILRFWESEFPQLTPDKSQGGQSVYSRRDLDLVVLGNVSECTGDLCWEIHDCIVSHYEI